MSNCSKVATHFSKPVQAPWKLLKVSLMFSDMIITGKQAWKRHWRCSSHRNPVTPLARVCYSTDGFSLSFYLFDTSMTEQTLPGHWGNVPCRAGVMLCMLLQTPNGCGAAATSGSHVWPPLASCAALKLSTAFHLSWVQRKAKLNPKPNKQALSAPTSLSALLKLFFNFLFACLCKEICSHLTGLALCITPCISN